MTFIRNTIDDAYIDVEGTIIPIASFRVTFTINELPAAEIVPAIGRELTTGKISTIEDIQEDQEAKLYFVFNGATKLLLSGFIQKISASDNATMFNRRVSARLRIIHRAVKLAGAPGLSYAYTADMAASLAELSEQRTGIDPITGERDVSFNQVFVRFGKAGSPEGTEVFSTAIVYPTSFLKRIVEGLVRANSPNELPADLIKTYPPANLLNIDNLGPIDVVKYVQKQFSQAWGMRNTFEALRATCDMLFLGLVFYNEGFYITNPNSLINTPTVNLVSDDYLSIAFIKTSKQMEDVNGVVVRHPFGLLPNQKKESGLLSVYPPINPEDISGGVEDTPSERRYYHFANLPAWLYNTADSQWSDRGNIGKVNRGKRKGLARKQERAVPLPVYFNLVGPRLAKALYAKLKADKAGVTLTLPYREDLMPGTIISIENTDTVGVKFMGNTVFGMIHTLNIVLDVMSESPGLKCVIEVVSVRSELDNRDAPIGYGLSENPLYQGNWVGCDLFGELLADLPPHQPQIIPATRTNNANAGGAVGRPPSNP